MVDGQLRALNRARMRRDLAELDYRRQLLLSVAAASQQAVASELGLSPTSLAAELRLAEGVSMPVAGFGSASPYEVCQRYAAGELGREEAIAQLVAWPYVSTGPMRTSPGDDLMIVPDGTFQEVVQATLAGLIDEDMYGVVLDAVRGHV